MIKKTRKNLIEAIGVKAIHALEDGFVLGALFILSLTYPLAVTALTTVLFGDGLGPKKIINRADEIVRVDDIQAQKSYFIFAFLSTVGTGTGLYYFYTGNMPVPF